MCVDVLMNRVTQPAVLQPRCVNPHCKPWMVKENHTFSKCNLKDSFMDTSVLVSYRGQT